MDTDSQMSIKQMRRESFTISPTWYRGSHQLTVTGGMPAEGGRTGRRRWEAGCLQAVHNDSHGTLQLNHLLPAVQPLAYPWE